MLYRDASKIARQKCTGPVTGNINQGEKVRWEDTKVKLLFVPDHAFTKEGRLFITDKATGKTTEL